MNQTILRIRIIVFIELKNEIREQVLKQMIEYIKVMQIFLVKIIYS